MKTITITLTLVFSILASIAFGQLDKLSTFEEMWVVSPELIGFDGKTMLMKEGFGDPKSLVQFSKAGSHSVTDLLKIIADTPFLSLELDGTNSKKYVPSKTTPTLRISKVDLNQKEKIPASYMLVVASGKKHFLLVPLAVPDVLEKLIAENGLVLESKLTNLEQVDLRNAKMEFRK